MSAKFLTIAVLAAPLLWSAVASAAEIEVVVRGVRHDQGAVKAVLYASPETFRKEEKALAVQGQPAKAGEVSFVFSGLAEGRYALVVYHDENGNGHLDRFLGMIPTEGYGLSNNPEVSGPPAFEPSAVDVGDAQPARAVIDLRY